MKTIHRNDSEHTSRSRDAAVRRLGRANRWLIAGSAVLTGVLTDVAANAFPGHSIASRTRAAGRTGKHARHKPLAPPAHAPKTTTQATPPPAQTTESAPHAESSTTEPAPESQAAPETEAAPETTATPEPTPAPVEAPAPETHEAETAPEASGPVVSGGS